MMKIDLKEERSYLVYFLFLYDVFIPMIHLYKNMYSV